MCRGPVEDFDWALSVLWYLLDMSERPRVILVNRCVLLNDDNQILLIRRSLSDSHLPGLWECPGGKLDQGQDLTHAREREVMEETGLLINLTHPLVYADSYVVGEGKYIGLPYVCLFGIGKSVGGKLALSDEHAEFAWASYDEALSYNLTPESRKALIVMKDYLVS
jgi:8-oxo-dGTP diphosphatase